MLEDVGTGDLGQSQELMRTDLPPEPSHHRHHHHHPAPPPSTPSTPPMPVRHPLDGQHGMGLWRVPQVFVTPRL